MEELQNKLNEAIPRSVVRTRKNGNFELDYLEGHYVIDRLNRIFGPLGWATSITELRPVFEGQVESRSGPVHATSYLCRMRLVVECDGKQTEHNDVGYGDGTDKANPGKAHELASKEAWTDALKRCAKNLGQSMGLALYDKTQTNVDDTPVIKQPTNAKKVVASSPQPELPLINGDEGVSETLLTSVRRQADVLVKQGRVTYDELKAHMHKCYSIEATDKLLQSQAKDFLSHMKAIGGQNNERTT